MGKQQRQSDKSSTSNHILKEVSNNVSAPLKKQPSMMTRSMSIVNKFNDLEMNSNSAKFSKKGDDDCVSDASSSIISRMSNIMKK